MSVQSRGHAGHGRVVCESRFWSSRLHGLARNHQPRSKKLQGHMGTHWNVAGVHMQPWRGCMCTQAGLGWWGWAGLAMRAGRLIATTLLTRK